MSTLTTPEIQSTPAQESTVDRDGGSPRVNVGPSERLVGAIIGGALAATGLALLGQRRSTSSALVGLTLGGAGAAMLYRGFSGYCPAYEALGVSERGGMLSNPFTRGVQATASIMIDRSPDDIYAFYRDFTNLPSVMHGVETIEKLDGAGTRTRWVVNTTPGHVGPSVEWVAVLTDDQPGARIAWESEKGAAVTTRGHVDLIPQPHGRGTLVRAYAEYHPLGGALAAALAKATGSDPRSQMQQDLRRLKAYMETGEVPTTEGQPRGNCVGH